LRVSRSFDLPVFAVGRGRLVAQGVAHRHHAPQLVQRVGRDQVQIVARAMRRRREREIPLSVFGIRRSSSQGDL